MPKKAKELTVLEPVEPLIRELRGERVLLDSDLARIYGVPTKRLNEQVRRNADRFPQDFMFRLTETEADSLRSQFATLKSGRGQHRKYLPLAFTEHGAIAAAYILNSPRAVKMGVFVVRAFVALRREAGRFEALGRKLAELERTQSLHGEDIQVIFAALRQLEETSSWAYPEDRRLIGFRPAGPKKSSAKEQD